MIASMARVRRALGCIAGAAMVGVLAALLVQGLGYSLHVTLSIALALAAGLGIAVGIEAAEARLSGAGQTRRVAYSTSDQERGHMVCENGKQDG